MINSSVTDPYDQQLTFNLKMIWIELRNVYNTT